MAYQGAADADADHRFRAGLSRPRGDPSFWRTWAEAWETPTFEYEEFIDAGDTVVSVLSQRMRGRTSGIEQEWNAYAQNWTIKDGKIVGVEFFVDRAQALKAAGLSE